MQFWAITPIQKTKEVIIIVQCINKIFLKILKHQSLSIFKIYFIKHKLVYMVNKMTVGVYGKQGDGIPECDAEMQI